MISEREKQRRFGVAVDMAKEHLPEHICGIAIRCVEQGYMQGKPVVIFNEHGSLIFGEQELKAITGGDTAVPALVQYGVTDNEWNDTEAPEFLEVCRQCIYLQALAPAPETHVKPSAFSEWWKGMGISNLDDLESPRTPRP
jgi:hypothetical protein